MNQLWFGDNLDILRNEIADESVDLIYLDPPFNSKASYNVLFKSPRGRVAQAQAAAFEDTWRWGDPAQRCFDEVIAQGGPAAAILKALKGPFGTSQMMAYLANMTVRLIELHRVLKPTGSLYLHCDPTASHYIKIVLDAIFGAERFKSEIVWKRSSAHSDAKQGASNYGHIHDLILFYAKSKICTWNVIHTPYEDDYVASEYRLVDDATGRRFRRGDLTAAKPGGDVEYDWRVKKRAGIRERWVGDLDDEYLSPKAGWEYKAVGPYTGRFWGYSKENLKQFEREGRIRHTYGGMPEYKRFLDEMPGVPLQDIWTDIKPIPSGAAERLGYPTQKPLPLLERIIAVSSNPGDLVLDPFCGCGTAVDAAEKLGRRWIGIDITHVAIQIIEGRLNAEFKGQADYEVKGSPTEFSAARDLASRDKHEFQLWAAKLVGAAPEARKKGPDRGIDGIIYYLEGRAQTNFAVISVKGGKNLGVSMIRELIAVVKKEGAGAGVFVCLETPTRNMVNEALDAGRFNVLGKPYPKIQICTVEALLAGKRPNLPLTYDFATLLTLPRATGRAKKADPKATRQQLEMMMAFINKAPDELPALAPADFDLPEEKAAG